MRSGLHFWRYGGLEHSMGVHRLHQLVLVSNCCGTTTTAGASAAHASTIHVPDRAFGLGNKPKKDDYSAFAKKIKYYIPSFSWLPGYNTSL